MADTIDIDAKQSLVGLFAGEGGTHIGEPVYVWVGRAGLPTPPLAPPPFGRYVGPDHAVPLLIDATHQNREGLLIGLEFATGARLTKGTLSRATYASGVNL